MKEACVKKFFKKRCLTKEPNPPNPRSHWKKILVPVDFSSCSRAALKFAVNYAADLRAQLTVVHVVENHLTGSIELDLVRLFQPDGFAAAKELKCLVQDEIPIHVRSPQLVLHGAPAHEIIHIAREKRIDLIILPTHCRTGWQHARLGSVAEQVIQRTPCPVLILPFPNSE